MFETNCNSKIGSIKSKTTSFFKNIDIRICISKMEEEIEELYMEIGELVCRCCLDSGAEISSMAPIRHRCNKIYKLKKEILILKKKLYCDCKGIRFCDKCNEFFEDDNIFCSICGQHLN
ncbi:MAG: hypothetical protein WC996_04490 [Peptostreptococcales bacterium]